MAGAADRAELLAGHHVRVPVLVAVGTEDVIGGSGPSLRPSFRAPSCSIKGRDHMKAVGDAGGVCSTF